MMYRGQMKNGVVEFQEPVPLEEGTVVDVQPVAAPADQPRRGSAEAVLRHAGIWKSEVGEVDRLLQELREMKQAELRDQLELGR